MLLGFRSESCESVQRGPDHRNVCTLSHQTEFDGSIVNPDMVWKPGELQSVYNELSFYVELASPCTNLLKFYVLIFQ